VEALPSSFAPFTGMLRTPEGVVPVLDLRRVLGHAGGANVAPPTTRIVVCSVQNLLIGMLVDRTRKLERYPSATVEPAPPALRCGEAQPFCAVIPQTGAHTYLLDLETILAGAGVDLALGEPRVAACAALAGKRILVVEDSRFFQKRCVEIFTAHGAKVDVAADGRAGLEALVAAGFAYDLLFVDIEMPYMSGVQMVRAAMSQWPAPIPVVFNSGISNPVVIEEIVGGGLGEYLVKFSEADIVATVTRVLGGAQPGERSTSPAGLST
jgi:CheY-like chemotaxis protein/chemotaxis signal transduction protein